MFQNQIEIFVITVNILNATGLFTVKWLISCYENFTSVTHNIRESSLTNTFPKFSYVLPFLPMAQIITRDRRHFLISHQERKYLQGAATNENINKILNCTTLTLNKSKQLCLQNQSHSAKTSESTVAKTPVARIQETGRDKEKTKILGKVLNSFAGLHFLKNEKYTGNSLAVQWLGLYISAQGPGLIPGWATKILQAVTCGQKKKKKVH